MMPVVSPSRYSSNTSSSLSSGSYRSTITSSSSLDKPYYRTSSGTYSSSTLRTNYGDKTTEYRSRYSDVDGKRERKSSLVEYSRSSRAPSVTDSDSGISSRYRSERSESRSRDISTTRSDSGKSVSEPIPRPKRSVISTAALAMSTAELYNKYSPANYVPLTQRLAQAEISRSKSISGDIGRPPAPEAVRAARNPRTSSVISERLDSSRQRYKEDSPTSSYPKRGSNEDTDTNGNDVPSVSEIRKRFDPKMTVTKLPANEPRLVRLENSSNSKLRENVPVHSSSGTTGRNGDSNSSELNHTISKTMSEPVSLAKSLVDKIDMSKSLNAKLPSDHSIRNQLDSNNPIGKILEKSTVIQVENQDADGNERKRCSRRDTVKPKPNIDLNMVGKNLKHTNNYASYIPVNHAVPSTSKTQVEINNEYNEELNKLERKKNTIRYIDCENDERTTFNSDSNGTGFENQTFEHENYLKKRSDDDRRMDTGAECTIGDRTDSSPDSPVAVRRRLIHYHEELAGGKSGRSLRRSQRYSDSEDRLIVGLCDGPHLSGLNGLRNIGNTCFMNSVLQCLSNTKPLLEYVREDAYLSDINTTLSCMKGSLIKAFTVVVKELWQDDSHSSVVNTTAFKSQVQRFAPRFMGYYQQDAQEFLCYLLEGLHEDVNRVTVKPTPIHTEIDDNLSDVAKAAEAWSRYLRIEDSRIGDIFMGQLKSTLRCTHCEHDSVTFDPFWDLSLPIPNRAGNLMLGQCLEHFTRQEEMDGDEKPTCSKCGVRRKCLKWFTVQKFPQVLVLHLKRFSPNERFRGKLNLHVEFPLNGLDMSPYASNKGQEATYNLYAVSNHSAAGTKEDDKKEKDTECTTYSGHYTAYCKHPYAGKWHAYNDPRVTKFSENDVCSMEAYVLFYELAKPKTT